MSVLIRLPRDGTAPHMIPDADPKNIETIQSVVGGWFECLKPSDIVILDAGAHTNTSAGELNWGAMKALFETTRFRPQVYVHDEGRTRALEIHPRVAHTSGPVFGDVAVVCTRKAYEQLISV